MECAPEEEVKAAPDKLHVLQMTSAIFVWIRPVSNSCGQEVDIREDK